MKYNFSHRLFAALLMMLVTTVIVSCEKREDNPMGGIPQNPAQSLQEQFTLSRSNAGAKQYDVVMMFKVMRVLKCLTYNMFRYEQYVRNGIR